MSYTGKLLELPLDLTISWAMNQYDLPSKVKGLRCFDIQAWTRCFKILYDYYQCAARLFVNVSACLAFLNENTVNSCNRFLIAILRTPDAQDCGGSISAATSLIHAIRPLDSPLASQQSNTPMSLIYSS